MWTMSAFVTMSSEERSRMKFLELKEELGYGLELKKCSKKNGMSSLVKEKILSPQAKQCSKIQNKFTEKNPCSRPHVNLHSELKQNVDDHGLLLLKSSGNHQNQMDNKLASKDEELIKYMSNLPAYLQRTDKGERRQDKALNFGVLDWERLENWKHKKNHISATLSMNGPSTHSILPLLRTVASSANSSPAHGEIITLQSTRHHPSICSNLDPSHSKKLPKGAKPSRGKVICPQGCEAAPKSSLDGQQKFHRSAKSLGKIDFAIKNKKDRKTYSTHNITSEMGTSLSNSRNYGFTFSSVEKMSTWDGGTRKNAEGLQELISDFSHPHSPSKRENIVLLLPRDSPRKSCNDLLQLSEPRTFCDKNLMDASRKSYSDGFPPEEDRSAEPCSDVPHSCPLPCKIETDALDIEFFSDAYQTTKPSNASLDMQYEGKHIEKCKSKIKQSTSVGFENSEGLNQEHADLATAKGRNPSPNRLFGIGLGRLSRSFSLKEGSAVPQFISTYISVKSGPVRSEASACLDNSNKEKFHAHSRSRSSPLRRLLDPLLKPKPANLHPAEVIQQLEGCLNSDSFKGTDARDSIQNEKHEPLNVQALLQVTFKNELPLFKFVVDNKSDILATTVKKLVEPGKDDPNWIYTFYSVREMKKKSGSWINQGNRGKSGGYVYNVVGQMKVSCPKDQNRVRESVLYSVELEHSSRDTKFMPSRELAAIVIKIPSKKVSFDEEEKVSLDGEESNKHEDAAQKGHIECSLEGGCFCSSEENSHNNSTTVILQSDIHGLPNQGVPTPLIDRWKSGGLCDCGGWDVGCKLRILTKQDPNCKSPGLSKAYSITNDFSLSVQGGTRESKPLFSLVPFKNGIFSVKFNTSISFLQAFSICVAVISCEKSSSLSRTKNLSEAWPFLEPTSSACNGTSSTQVQGEVPPKYVSFPPHSPVGRV